MASPSSVGENIIPISVFSKVFPYLRDDPCSWYSLAHCNYELHQLSKQLQGPRKWPTIVANWQAETEDKYVHQVKFSPNGRHMALMLRVYDNSDATEYHRVVRVLDIDHVQSDTEGIPPLLDIPVGRSTPFTAYCGQYFVAVEPRRVRVFDSCQNYAQVQEIPSLDRIVGMKVVNSDTRTPLIALQTDSLEGNEILLWGLLNGQFHSRIPYNGSANFVLSEDGRIFACIDGGPEDNAVTLIYLQSCVNGNDNQPTTHVMNLPGNPRRSWNDCCQFAPDTTRLAVLTEDVIFQLDTTTEPPRWIHNGQFRAPDRCAFSGQMVYNTLLVDSNRQLQLIAHSRTQWDQAYRRAPRLNTEHYNVIQIFDADANQLIATKGFHDLMGSVGLSPDGKLAVVLQGEEPDVYRNAIAWIITRYVAAMEDHTLYPLSGDYEHAMDAEAGDDEVNAFIVA